MGSCILLSPIGEIADNAVDVLGGGHNKVHGFEAWLLFTVGRDALDHFGCQ